jgi:hypothetical protein
LLERLKRIFSWLAAFLLVGRLMGELKGICNECDEHCGAAGHYHQTSGRRKFCCVFALQMIKVRTTPRVILEQEVMERRE